jgi:flagellar hook-associated protein 2
VRDRVSKLVSDFNSMAATLGRLRAWDPATRKGGPLIGDSTLLGVESRVRRDLASAVTASGESPTTLAAVGVSMGADGRLTLNDARFTAALQKDPAGVARLFAGDDGIAKRLHATLEGAVGTGGQVPSRTDSLQSQKRDLQKAKEALDLRMQSVERRYRAQFTALDSLLSGLQSTGSYLARQLR